MRLVVLPGLALVSLAMAAPPALATNNQVTGATDNDGTDLPATRTVVCRTLAPETGSRIGPRRICKTEQEWAMSDREARENTERAARTRLNCTNDPNGAGVQCEQ